MVGLQIVVNEHNFDQLDEICSKLLNKFPSIDYINIRPIELKISEESYTINQLIRIEQEFKYIDLLNQRSKINP